MKRVDLSVVVLCYKSGELARTFSKKLISSIKKVTSNYEVVLVGNYNSLDDPTPAIIRQVAKGNRRVIALTKKKQGMMGWDMRSGLAKASGKYIAVIDGDNQFKPELVMQVYKKLLESGADFAKARRVRRDDGMYRLIISKAFNTFFHLLFDGHYFSDVNAKPKVFTRAALKSMVLEDNGWFIDAEIMIQAKLLQLKIAEVPVRFHQNKYRKSFVGTDAIIEVGQKLLLYKLREVKKTLYDFAYGRLWLYWTKTTPAA